MSGYLLDTSIVSAFGPAAPPMRRQVSHWFERREQRQVLFLSSVVIAEIERGTRKLQRLGAVERANALGRWLDRLLMQFSQRVLPVDTRVGRLAGELYDGATAKGRNPGLADVLIAATAKASQLSILTSNVRHFDVLDIPHLDPFKALPED
jgi:predicted nucleic acid-binding protein